MGSATVGWTTSFRCQLTTMTSSNNTILMCVFLIISQLVSLREATAFVPKPHNNYIVHGRYSSHGTSMMPSLNLVTISLPSSDEAAKMGVRDWPQQTKGGSWEESSKDGDVLIRYVLDGTGTLDIVENGKKSSNGLEPGTLIQVDGEAKLSWTATSTNMIILTPNFEEGKVFLAVAAIVAVMFLVLLTQT